MIYKVRHIEIDIHGQTVKEYKKTTFFVDDESRAQGDIFRRGRRWYRVEEVLGEEKQ